MGFKVHFSDINRSSHRHCLLINGGNLFTSFKGREKFEGFKALSGGETSCLITNEFFSDFSNVSSRAFARLAR